MKYSIKSLACIAVLVGTIAQAEIYEGKDAEGNPVFTDSPAPGANQVELPQSNIADAVKPSAVNTQAADEIQEATQTHKPKGNIVVIPERHNEELQRELDADIPHEVLEAQPRHKVGDNVTAEERARREAAKEGIIVDEDANIERVEHRGHAEGLR